MPRRIWVFNYLYSLFLVVAAASIFCGLLGGACVRAGFETRTTNQNNNANNQAGIDGRIFAAWDFSAATTDATSRDLLLTKTDGATKDSKIDAVIPFNEIPVDLVLSMNNQSCGTAGEIDGTPLHTAGNIKKIFLNTNITVTNTNICNGDYAPFFLRVLNAPTTILAGCQDVTRGMFYIRYAGTNCVPGTFGVSGLQCSTSADPTRNGTPVAANQTVYMIICRDPAAGPAIIHLSGQ